MTTFMYLKLHNLLNTKVYFTIGKKIYISHNSLSKFFSIVLQITFLDEF